MRPIRPELALIVLGSLFGLAFIFAIPPFQVPDEGAHFFRAYAISERQTLSRFQGALGAQLPKGLAHISERFDFLSGQTESKTSFASLTEARDIRLGRERIFIPFQGTAVHTDFSYLPQIGGIVIGRFFTDRPADLLYATRAAVLLTSLLLIFVAIRLAPYFKWLIVIVALLPMSTFLRSSASPDGLLIGLAFLVLALSLRIMAQPFRRESFAMLTIAAAMLTLVKPYVLLPLLPLTSSRIRHEKDSRLSMLWIVAVVCASTGVLGLQARNHYAPTKTSVNAPQQFRHVISHPADVAWTVAADLLRRSPRYVAEAVGRLGWLDTPLPIWLVMGYVILMIFCAMTDAGSNRLLDVSSTLVGLLAVGAVLIVSLLQYLSWTPVGATTVDGIQGRYFIPIAPTALLLFSNRHLAHSNHDAYGAFISSIAAIGLLVTLLILFRRYYAA